MARRPHPRSRTDLRSRPWRAARSDPVRQRQRHRHRVLRGALVRDHAPGARRRSGAAAPVYDRDGRAPARARSVHDHVRLPLHRTRRQAPQSRRRARSLPRGRVRRGARSSQRASLRGGQVDGGAHRVSVRGEGDHCAQGARIPGYPLHPPKKPDQRRDRHLPKVRAPMLFGQGSRDVFGTSEEVAPLVIELAKTAPGSRLVAVKRRGSLSRRAEALGSPAGEGLRDHRGHHRGVERPLCVETRRRPRGELTASTGTSRGCASDRGPSPARRRRRFVHDEGADGPLPLLHVGHDLAARRRPSRSPRSQLRDVGHRLLQLLLLRGRPRSPRRGSRWPSPRGRP